ncbi:MAG: glycerophosphodiester phosphodiesterase [Firmicutes bacterium]|nr:glycerophosphodiester phosphodiesterase [Bacillota bacterium]
MDNYISWLINKKIAHRGFHNDDAPENTLAAFGRAIESGYAIELDVREIDDGTVVVFHDDRLSRLTGVDGFTSQLKIEELDDMRILKTNCKIPTLAQVLDFVAGRTPLLIEIKNSNKVGGLEKSVIEILKKYEGDFAVQSFNPYSLEYFKKSAPHILRGQLSCSFKNEKSLNRIKKFLLRRMKLNRRVSEPNFISYDFNDLPCRAVSKYFGKIPVLAWTLRSDTDCERARPYSDNIIFEGFTPAE